MKVIRVICTLLLLSFASQLLAQTAVIRFRQLSGSGTTFTIAGVWSGNLESVAVGDTILVRNGDQCHVGVLTSIQAQDAAQRTFTGVVSGIPDIRHGEALLYRGAITSVPPNLPPHLLGCVLDRMSFGGVVSQGTPTFNLVYTLEMTSLYQDHPGYPRKAGDNFDSLELAVDVAPYLQQVIDSAAATGGTVLLGAWQHTIKSQINVPEGVIIKGQSAGKYGVYSLPYEPWRSSGTIIYFEPSQPNQAAFYFRPSGGYEARLGGIEDVTIMGSNIHPGTKAIVVDGDGAIFSSGHFEDVHIHGFRDGVGIMLTSGNGGGVTYTTFEDIRIRDADTSVFLFANANGFTNTNTFERLFVSGGALDYGILAMTYAKGDPTADCNHNRFIGGSIEPQYSRYGHLVVKNDAWLIVKDARFEATQQIFFWPDTPIIRLFPGTQESYIEALATVPIQNDGNNYVSCRSPKNAYPNAPSTNRFNNSNLNGLYVNDSSRYVLPYYQIGTADFSSSLYTSYTGDTIPIDLFSDTTGTLPPEWNVLRFRIPPGKKIRLWQQPFTDWEHHLGEFFTVGAYVFSYAENAAQWIYTSNDGTSSTTVGSEFPYETGKWSFVGGTFQNYKTNTTFLVYLTLFNDPSLNADTVDILVAMPVFYWGDEIPLDVAGNLPKTGGAVDGPLSLSFLPIIDINEPRYIDTSGNTTRLYLPVRGNVFRLKSDIPRTILSINVAIGASANNPYAEFFKGGTMITIINESPGLLRINNSDYIHLKGGEDWNPNISGSYLTLINDPVAMNSWYEVGRGQLEINLGAIDLDLSNPTYHDQGNQYNLAVPPGYNVVNLIGSRGSGILRYICQVTGARKPGEMLMIKNLIGPDSTITLQYPFVETYDGQNYDLPYNQYIILMQTQTIGVWREVARSEKTWVNKGFLVIDPATSSQYRVGSDASQIIFPKGYHYVQLIGTQTVINRINEYGPYRRPQGDIIVLENATGSDVTLNQPYIMPVYSGIFKTVIPNQGRAVLISTAPGVWQVIEVMQAKTEVGRSRVQHDFSQGGPSPNVNHYVFNEHRINDVPEFIEGAIVADMSAGEPTASVVVTSTPNFYKGMEVYWSAQDASGDGKVEMLTVTWGYNASPINVNTVSSHESSSGGYGGSNVTVTGGTNNITINIVNNTETTNMKIWYKLF